MGTKAEDFEIKRKKGIRSVYIGLTVFFLSLIPLTIVIAYPTPTHSYLSDMPEKSPLQDPTYLGALAGLVVAATGLIKALVGAFTVIMAYMGKKKRIIGDPGSKT